MPVKSTVLARELSVSRTPVVQALQRLAADGLVRLELNKRAVIRPGAEKWLDEIHQLRELLEPQATRLAATHITTDAIAHLETLAQAAQPHKSPDWMDNARKFDFAIHLAIADGCGNLALASAIRKCWSFKRVSYEAGNDAPEVVERGYQEHRAILDALQARNPETAHIAMLFHLRSASSLRSSATIV